MFIIYRYTTLKICGARGSNWKCDFTSKFSSYDLSNGQTSSFERFASARSLSKSIDGKFVRRSNRCFRFAARRFYDRQIESFVIKYIYARSYFMCCAGTEVCNDHPGPQLMFRFDNTPYDVVNDNHLSCLKTCQYTQGICGSAIIMDGKQRLSVNMNGEVSEDNFTVAMWFKGKNGGLFSMDNVHQPTIAHDRHVYVKNGQLHVRTWDHEVTEVDVHNLDDNRWHHVIYGIGEAGEFVWIDGSLSSHRAEITRSKYVDDTYVYVGWSFDASYYVGLLDSLYVFDHLLTEDDAFILYMSRTGKSFCTAMSLLLLRSVRRIRSFDDRAILFCDI